MIKKIIVTLLLLSSLCCTLQIQTFAAPATTPSNIESVTPFADLYEWRYKVINGELYKRLYNKTQEKWVGPWIAAN